MEYPRRKEEEDRRYMMPNCIIAVIDISDRLVTSLVRYHFRKYEDATLVWKAHIETIVSILR